MNRKIKFTASIFAIAVICFCCVMTVGIYRTHFSAEALARNKVVYAGLLSSEINRRWACVPEANRIKFVLGLMERFSPEDKKILSIGRQRKLALLSKQEAGELTVADREELNSGKLDYNAPRQDFWAKDTERLMELKNENLNLFGSPVANSSDTSTHDVFSGGNFTASSCANESCNTPRVSISLNGLNLHVLYEDRFTRWMLPRAALEAEYERLPWRERADAIQTMKRHEASIALDMLSKAEEEVARLPASEVPSGSENARISAEHKKLICAELGI